MSTTTNKLKLVFNRADVLNKTMTMSFNYAKSASNMSSTDVSTLCTAIITNGSIFAKTPGTAKSASLVVTTTTDFDIAS